MICTRCGGTGFLNIEQIPGDDVSTGTIEEILAWIKSHSGHDVQVCDCCGDGENWYGHPGYHYEAGDVPGSGGPYADNGGLCKCH